MGKNNHKGFDSFVSTILATKKAKVIDPAVPVVPVAVETVHTDADLLKMAGVV